MKLADWDDLVLHGLPWVVLLVYSVLFFTRREA